MKLTKSLSSLNYIAISMLYNRVRDIQIAYLLLPDV